MSWDKVDWSQAPEGAMYWCCDPVGLWLGIFYNVIDDEFQIVDFHAPRFGYTGHPRDSLTARPTEKTS